MKILIALLLLFPFVSHAGTFTYDMEEGETIQEVAEKFNVPVGVIADDENNPNRLTIPTSEDGTVEQAGQILATSTDNTAEIKILKAQISQLRQIVQLLIQLVELKNHVEVI